METNSRRFYEVLVGLLLLIIGFTAFSESGGPLILLALAGFYLLARQFDQSRRTLSSSGEARASQVDAELYDFDLGDRRTEQVYSHALKAVERVGRDPGEIQVLPVDIGVMAFRGDQEAMIYRTRGVPDDIDYLQPFVQLRLPQKATGRIRFEIIDSDGQSIFIHEDYHQLERGRNLVSPSARLPIHDAQAMSGDWEMRISADGMLLAEHRFSWQETSSRVIRRHIAEDGEVSSELRAMVAENRLQKMSLDDLLFDQSEDEQQAQRK